jgi:transcriptional regulator with XRE-family HTH domain
MKWDGNRLKYLRTKKKLTQEILGKKLDKAMSTISGYEINNSEPDVDTIVLMANILDTTTDYLLGVSDEPDIKIYHYNELPELVKEAGIENLRSLKDYKLEELTLDELTDLIEVAKKIKERQKREKPST